jgi:hypothetical protein
VDTNAQYYDLNVWGSDSNTLYLTAYEWETAPDGQVQMNSSRYHTIPFKALDDLTEIEFLLGDLFVNHHPLTDYDEWRDLSDVYNDKTPSAIRRFLDNLPPYNVPAIALLKPIKENA